ncbi:Protein MON2 homolog-like Protein [Tribolium castaneum]|uniref:Protein MON2 homolog n=1 Tax=Tribolium castaneum TaxID=7070 RepID=D6W829_TRICA|nr:PREDICTED: protein MON2 homolog isoform X1 [Tribolium castaneum]EFA11008.1 Protein MON2 homolog-like Protein [Tribolium castaneum]|eukprot:XP_008200722.1 PREDICTED: protein MON2 homolog isoform X1 [Tribolium castaneum]
MAFENGVHNVEVSAAFIESLQTDFKNLASESKKKYPVIKESCEEAIVKLKAAVSTPQTSIYYVINQIIYPLSQGCETKDVKLIKGCLQIIQKLITHQLIDQKGALYITDTLWTLMESGIEEVKILQSVTLLLTTNTVVHGDTLARTLVLCFRLHFAKNSTTINTAGATVRQLVSLVFERVVAEDELLSKNDTAPVQKQINMEDFKVPSGTPPKGLPPCAADAYLLFQDLVQLVNADQPYWLIGMTEMTRTFGLELLESVLTQFSVVFYKNAEFSFLLKERVCALVIKLFSPNIKYRSTMPSNVQQATPFEKPYFPISMRLLRVVSILIQKYHSLLVTECEIFLSLIVKFLDPDKPTWQRSLALEVLHKMTIQPELLNSFCKCYDLNKHTTSIFQDIVNSLGAYVQSLFVNAQLQMTTMTITQGQPPVFLGGLPAGPGVSPQPGFLMRGVWLPIVTTFPTGQTKSIYLEMLDKIEPPTIPDGYGISIAYASLLEIIRSLQITIGPQQQGEAEPPPPPEPTEDERKLHTQLIISSWCGLLAALTPLIDASTDESVTENILKALQTYASLSGELGLDTPRDAFITAICKSSLPPHYALTVLNTVSSGIRTGHRDGQELHSIANYGEADYRQQVVAVGTPLPTSSVPAGTQQGPVMLTSKNLQAMRALLSLAHCHGSILGTSWHLVLTTLQHLVWILGLKPSTGGSLKAGRFTTDSNAVITTSVMADLPVLSQMLSRLFETSQYLDDVALHHLINALCKLSQEAMELAYSNREPSLFAVAKLLETGLVNMPRIEVLWRPLTNHLLEVCRHPHIRMREWGVEAITYLVKSALHYKHTVPLRDNQKLQTLLLGPLFELSSVPHGDVRQRQLECVLEILHGAGETLSHGWPLVLGIIGAVSDQHGENLIRIAFQCLQLVITDFLPVMPWRCLPLCVDTVAKFGSQTQELNISLTAVGLMWNISDYFHQNQGKLSQTLTEDTTVLPDFPGTLNMPSFDKLWMCLYARLGELCVDSRPAVRKSAGQTLFSTISAHGGLLKQSTWQAILWQVLFPLLDKVRNLSNSASSEKVDAGGNILIHHTRNTAQKQWAETQVLTLSGVARVFNTKRQLLQALGDFPRAWSILLEFIENAALSKNNEVSIAALKSFQEILFVSKTQPSDNKALIEDREIWAIAWRVWVKIGTEITIPALESEQTDDFYFPSQTFLTALVQIFPSVFQHIKSNFNLDDLKQLGTVLTNAVSVPVYGESTPYMISTSSDVSLTPLHDGVLHTMELLQKEALARNNSKMIPELFKRLLIFARFTCTPPNSTRLDNRHAKVSDWITMNYIPFGEKAMTMTVKLYEKTAENPEVIGGNILHGIIAALHKPLALKYNCFSNSIWKLAANSLITVLKTGLKVARANGNQFAPMWPELAATLNDFLFPSMAAPADKGLDEMVSDEATDCQLIELLRTEVLPYSSQIPKDFIMQVVVLLNKGSIHSATNVKTDSDSELTLREEFAKTCFETLLQFSLIDGDNRALVVNGDDLAGQLAVTSLLQRFQEVLEKYIEDEKLSGKCPLPRYRLSEISFVLKAVTTLIISMKKAPVKEDSTGWEHLIKLYPFLVECTTTTSTQVSRPLREALIQFCDLLQPPVTKKTNGEKY